MSKPKFDSKTTKKLISTYQSTISHYTAENDLLSSQLQDLKTTLGLNQSLLFDFIISTIGKNEEISKLISESKTLWQENEQLIQQKNDLEMKTAKLQELIEDTPTEIREELKTINESNEKMKVQLIQKEQLLKKLKSDLDKARRNALFKTARTEVLVTVPTKINVEINHELLNTKSILLKVTSMHAQEKKKADRLDKEVKTLQTEVINLRRNTIENNNNINNNNTSYFCSDVDGGEGGEEENKTNSNVIETTNVKTQTGKKVLTTSGVVPKLNFRGFEKKKVYTQTIVKKTSNNDPFQIISSSSSEKEEEDNESDEDSDYDNNFHNYKRGKKKPKSKQKELDMLTEEYNKLKKQNEEYENKIQRYKSIYKDMKSKIQNLNQMSRGQVKSERRHNNINIPAASTDDATSHKNV